MSPAGERALPSTEQEHGSGGNGLRSCRGPLQPRGHLLLPPSMASQHQQLLCNAETICDPGGDGPVLVHISKSGMEPEPKAQQPFKYSISSSCSSGESTAPKTATERQGMRRVPQLFEQSAAQCWDPRFDSPILEQACRERCFPQTQRHFRYVLFYLAAASLLWGVYFAANTACCEPSVFLMPTAIFFLFCLLLFLFTFTQAYTRLYSQASLLLITVTFALTLTLQAQSGGLSDDAGGGNISLEGARRLPCVSPVGTFSLCVEVLLLLYCVLHVRLYASMLLGISYSVVFEGLGWASLVRGSTVGPETLCWLVPARALLHLSAHVLGVHLFIASEVRSRSTFLKVGQAVMHGKDLEVEKALKERMIHSVMPRRVADELMKQGDDESESSGRRYSTSAASAGSVTASSSASPKGNKRKKTSIPRGQIIFRPFNMKRMEPVSILFADIVGFTRMSANKSAHALVGLLNDLFGRFDRLCELTCCEKISTLGDCYYCVAGCPEPRADHAYCCVEMGLGMIHAIEQFCRESRETVDMRVGVHTGTVLCGILGMKRFKFDVWSNDVNLANLMEQLGVAGKVHLSEATASFLDERYWKEDGQVEERHGRSVVVNQLRGLKTYLISGRKMDSSQCSCAQYEVDGRDPADPLGQEPGLHGPSVIPSTAGAPEGPHNRSRAGCAVCSGRLMPGRGQTQQDNALQNGGQDEHMSHSDKVSPDQSHRTLNGLLPPPREEVAGSSQTSLSEMLQDKLDGLGAAADRSTLIPLRAKVLRQRSDEHFVEVIKGDSLMKEFFFKPPINKLSLKFKESLEVAYRSSFQEELETQAAMHTFTSPIFSSFLDVLISCVVFFLLEVACFLRLPLSRETPPLAAVAFAVLAGLFEVFSLLLSVRMAFYLDSVLSCTQTLLRFISAWVPRHLIGAVLVSLPAVSVFTHVICSYHLPIQFAVFLCCAAVIAIVYYCNFCQLSFWMRSSLATVVGIAVLVLLHGPVCRTGSSNWTNGSSNAEWPLGIRQLLGSEAVLAFFLLLLLVWFLNRELEMGYRLHYHGNVEADRHRVRMQNMRDQADWLLGNIIPMHVAEQLKVTQSYSKNHDDVAVIFASIVNFSEFYEESYEGGKECYRVLNELIGDFDELLRWPAFAHVEKIKTIGATYMAASGLNSQRCLEEVEPCSHLRALFDFALEMMHVVDDFNKNMLGFQFKLRIGYNHGPLTAGVIGTTKLLYDIWGDTVNIASRMDSTGVECCVQVSEGSHAALSRMDYEFEYRGTVNVKGKGHMRTFLYPQQQLATPRASSPVAYPPCPQGVALPAAQPLFAQPGLSSPSEKPQGSNGVPRTSEGTWEGPSMSAVPCSTHQGHGDEGELTALRAAEHL
ncbi:adenylate cyclase type 9-like [Arapaima gigas]